MKMLFIAIALQFAPQANENTSNSPVKSEGTPEGTTPPTPEVKNEAPVVKVYDSPKIQELRAARKEQNTKMGAAEFESDEWFAAQMEVYKIGKQIEAEIATLKNAELEAIQQELINERAGLLDNYDSAVAAFNADTVELEKLKPAQKTTERVEQNNALADAVKTAREIIRTELIAKYASKKSVSTVAQGESTTTTTGGRGNTGNEIKALLLAEVAAGKSNTDAVKAVIAKGYSRGTTGAVMTAGKKDGTFTND